MKKYYVRLCSLRSTALDMFLGSFELHERNYFSSFLHFTSFSLSSSINGKFMHTQGGFDDIHKKKKSRRHENYVYGVQKSEILLHKNNKLHQPWLMMVWDDRMFWVSLLLLSRILTIFDKWIWQKKRKCRSQTGSNKLFTLWMSAYYLLISYSSFTLIIMVRILRVRKYLHQVTDKTF